MIRNEVDIAKELCLMVNDNAETLREISCAVTHSDDSHIAENEFLVYLRDPAEKRKLRDGDDLNEPRFRVVVEPIPGGVYPPEPEQLEPPAGKPDWNNPLVVALNILEGFKESTIYEDHQKVDGWSDVQFDSAVRVLEQAVKRAGEEPGPRAVGPQPKMGINPVTLSPLAGDVKCVIGRMHVMQMKTCTIAMLRDNKGQIEDLGTGVFDEDHVISGLRHLFPHGELNVGQVEQNPPASGDQTDLPSG